MQIENFLKILTPSLMLCAAFFWKDLEKAPIYSESFANNSNYLTFELGHHRAEKGSRPFKGTWTTDSGERQVVGLVRHEPKGLRYVMDLPEGRFVGVLEKSGGCQPTLKYTVEQKGALIQRGQLKGAFCL